MILTQDNRLGNVVQSSLLGLNQADTRAGNLFGMNTEEIFRKTAIKGMDQNVAGLVLDKGILKVVIAGFDFIKHAFEAQKIAGQEWLLGTVGQVGSQGLSPVLVFLDQCVGGNMGRDQSENKSESQDDCEQSKVELGFEAETGHVWYMHFQPVGIILGLLSASGKMEK
jgi:hypothetical protein